MEGERERIVDFIRDFMETLGFKGAVIGVSGGLDSATVAFLLKEAIPGRILGLIMPERDSNPESIDHAKLICRELGIECRTQPITPVLKKLGVYSLQPPAPLVSYSMKVRYALRKWREHGEVYERDLALDGPEEFLRGVAYYRAKHRVRMCKLYLEAEKRGYAVVGTTNKTELMTGFYVKWGDDSVDVEPIAHLYKTQVRELARELGVPEVVIEKPPSPDLIPGVTDEFALGMDYTTLDRILMKMENGESLEGEDPAKVERVRKILAKAKMRELKSIDIESWGEFKESIGKAQSK